MNNQSYIIQNMQQLSKIDPLLKKDDGWNWYLQKEQGNIQDISFDTLFNSENKRYMIVAEPGYGKTRLLKEIVLKAEAKEKQAFFIDAKKIKSLSIEESLRKCKYLSDKDISEEDLQKKTQFKTIKNDFANSTDAIVCIDALDEVVVSSLFELLEKIEEFIENSSGIKIFLSCRTHHLKKINFDFTSLDFKFITLNPFGSIQIKHFLKNRLKNDIDFESMYKKSKISNLMEFISIPRYLYYFSELLKDGSMDEVVQMSRSSMFEHFIYRKLDKELQKNTPQSQIDLLKRVLEKLAFIMKIDGVSEITKDELMTVFDKMDSNFSHIAFRDDLIQKLYDRSLMKDNVDTVEFENQEFLDYLSAKELARFEKEEQVFFDIAVEPHILEVYPPWFYVLPFIFELKPTMIEIFIDFLNKNSNRVLSANYFQTLLDIEPEKISKELKSQIFDLVFDYYTTHAKWFDSYSSRTSRKLSRYYEDSKYQKIIDSIDGRKHKDYFLTVLRTNAVSIISLLIEDKKLDSDEIKFWQKKVSKWLKEDIAEYSALHRNIVDEFVNLSDGNFEWIKKHRFIFENGVQVQAEYARACFKIAPNDTFSIDVYLGTHDFWYKNKKDVTLSRLDDEYNYVLKLNTVESIKYALNKIWGNKSYYYRFCKKLDRGVYDENNVKHFKKNLLNICNDELLEFLKNLIVRFINKDNFFNLQQCNSIYKLFLEIILEKDKEYINKYIDILKNSFKTEEWYFYRSFLGYVPIGFISKYFTEFVNVIESIEDENIRFNILKQIYYGSPDRSEIRKKLANTYPEILTSNENKTTDYEKERQNKVCKDLIEKIEPEPGKFKTDLFQFFLNNKEILKHCFDYEKKYKDIVEFAKKVLKNNNPLERGRIKKNENGSATIWQVNYYKSCIDFVHKEKIALDQDTRDNVFRYLPFDINSDYETTLAVAKTPSSKAIQDIVDVYAGKRDDDLGIYHIRQFIELYNVMKRSQFESVLLEMLKNDKIDEYKKTYIVQSLPSNVLTHEIIKEYKKDLNKESNLYKEYLSTLILKHKDEASIEEAYNWTIQKAKNMEDYDSFRDAIEQSENQVSLSITHTTYPIDKDKMLLLLSSELSVTGREKGSGFLKEIVKRHLKYLLEIQSEAHKIIMDIEKFLEANKDKKDLHWFEYALQELKQVYINKVKESNIVSAIKKYNHLANKDYLSITSSFELMELIKDVIRKNIKLWIEDEGAYKYIGELAKKEKNTNAEDFIQKSIKSQIELALLKRGLRDTDYSIIREEQLLDDKRLDFTVRYGFIGSVMVELKLAHNSEAIPTTDDGKTYIEKLKKYMAGSNSDYGLFIIFKVKKNNKFKEQLNDLNKLYENIDNISVLGLDCINE